MSQSPLTPGQEAAVERHVTEVGEDLDRLTEVYRRLAPNRGRVQAALDVGMLVKEDWSHENAVALLTVAIIRLAECGCRT